MRGQVRKVEILPHPNCPDGFLVLFTKNKEKDIRERIDKVQKAVMMGLIERKYVPKQTPIEEKDNFYYFSIIVRYPRPELKQDLKEILHQSLGQEK